MFPLNNKSHELDNRITEKYEVQLKDKLNRLKDSQVIYIPKLWNRNEKMQIHFRKTGKAQPVICPHRFLKTVDSTIIRGLSLQIYNKFIEPSTSTQKISYTTTLRNTRYLIISLKYILLCHCQKYANKNIIFY